MQLVARKQNNGEWIHKNLDHLEPHLESFMYLKPKEIQRIVSTLKKIAIVRNPLDRIVSAWRSKFGPPDLVASNKQRDMYLVKLFGHLSL